VGLRHPPDRMPARARCLTTGSRAVPIYQTTSYQFRDTTHAANLFALAEMGNIYTRIMNPTQGVFEARIASLEGATSTAVGIPGALAVASGQAAETMAIMNLAEAGQSASSPLPRSTAAPYRPAPLHAAEVRYRRDLHRRSRRSRCMAAAVRPNTKAFYGETTVGNPADDVLDIEGVSAVAHENGVPLIVDNTVASPWLIRPLAVGCRHRRAFRNQVHRWPWHLHRRSSSSTVAASTSAPTTSSRCTPTPDASYHGLTYWPSASVPVRTSSRPGCRSCETWVLQSRRSTAFMFLQGLETLSLRMERHNANAQAVAAFLADHPQVEAVQHAQPHLVAMAWALPPKYSEGRGFGFDPGVRGRGWQGGRSEVHRGPRAA